MFFPSLLRAPAFSLNLTTTHMLRQLEANDNFQKSGPTIFGARDYSIGCTALQSSPTANARSNSARYIRAWRMPCIAKNLAAQEVAVSTSHGKTASHASGRDRNEERRSALGVCDETISFARHAGLRTVQRAGPHRRRSSRTPHRRPGSWFSCASNAGRQYAGRG